MSAPKLKFWFPSIHFLTFSVMVPVFNSGPDYCTSQLGHSLGPYMERAQKEIMFLKKKLNFCFLNDLLKNKIRFWFTGNYRDIE